MGHCRISYLVGWEVCEPAADDEAFGGKRIERASGGGFADFVAANCRDECGNVFSSCSHERRRLHGGRARLKPHGGRMVAARWPCQTAAAWWLHGGRMVAARRPCNGRTVLVPDRGLLTTGCAVDIPVPDHGLSPLGCTVDIGVPDRRLLLCVTRAPQKALHHCREQRARALALAHVHLPSCTLCGQRRHTARRGRSSQRMRCGAQNHSADRPCGRRVGMQ
jgi:ribosomal protein L34